MGRHGMTGTPTYNRWLGMRARCENPSGQAYRLYGARGVTVCERWRTFENFLADVGLCPSPKHSLDRIDNAKGYEPGNVRWATPTEQQRNKTNNHLLTVRGRTMPITAWAEEVGISASTIGLRVLRYGWEPERAISVPSRNHGRPLCEEDIRQIRCARALGLSCGWLGKLYGVHRTTIGDATNGRHWEGALRERAGSGT